MRSKFVPLLAAAAATTVLAACGMMGGDAKTDMTFFVSSTGAGKGADLGGLGGADQLCSRLASAAGSSGRDWRAYLSTVPRAAAPASMPAIASAQDRGATPRAWSSRRT